jgi:ribosomal protein S18 acetylase RimI-like enzyme
VPFVINRGNEGLVTPGFMAWSRCDLLRAEGTGGVLTQVGGQTVGFVLYKTTPANGSTLRRLVQRCFSGKATVEQRTRRIEILQIAVSPAWQHQGIGRALLKALKRQFWMPGDWIQAQVPETNLSAQLFMRTAVYEAVQVVSGCQGSEAAYVMKRSPS